MDGILTGFLIGVGSFLVLLVVATYLIKVLGVYDWDSSWGKVQLKFATKKVPHLSIALGNSIGLVVSTDGESRKIHLNMFLVSDQSKVIDNFKLIMDGKTKFRIKQFYSESKALHMRFPDHEIRLPLRIDSETIALRAEFETYDYQPFDFTKGVHIFQLYYGTENKIGVKRFKVNCAETNQRAIQLARKAAKETAKAIVQSDRFGKVSVLDIPILLKH